MKIAWFTPFSTTSAIGQYSASIVQHLSQTATVTVYVSDAAKAAETWLPSAPQVFLKSVSTDEVISGLSAYDIVIYNLGDNYLLHGEIFPVSRRYPGIVILHDLVMHHFFSGYYFMRMQDKQSYIDELAFAHGEPGRKLGQKIVQGQMGDIWDTEVMLQFHMAKSALHGSLGVITHSEFARREIASFASYPVTHLDFPNPKPRQIVKAQPYTDQKVHFLSFGMMNTNKMIDRVIDAIGNSSTLRERIIYDVIGTGNDQYISRLRKQIDRYGLGNIVKLHGFLSDEELHNFIAKADVIVNLRNPHFGETSWVLLESAFSAKPTVVWKHGSYDEYPDDTVVKVTETTLPASLERLACEEPLRTQLSERIQMYAQRTFNAAHFCEGLLQFIDLAKRGKPLLSLTDKLSAYINEIDSQNDTLIMQVTEVISHLLPKEPMGD